MRSQIAKLVLLCQLTGAFAGAGGIQISDGRYVFGTILLAIGFAICVVAALVHAGIDESL